MAQLEVFKCVGSSFVIGWGIALISSESDLACLLVWYTWWALEVYPGWMSGYTDWETRCHDCTHNYDLDTHFFSLIVPHVYLPPLMAVHVIVL